MSVLCEQQPLRWAQRAIANVAASGKFSSDRTIEDYAREIWDMPVTRRVLPNPHETTPDKDWSSGLGRRRHFT